MVYMWIVGSDMSEMRWELQSGDETSYGLLFCFLFFFFCLDHRRREEAGSGVFRVGEKMGLKAG